jgi:Sodium/hydrogen exchanger family
LKHVFQLCVLSLTRIQHFGSKETMITTIQTLVLLLAVVAAVVVVAARLKIPQSILLVLTGVVLALIPGLPTIELSPEFVLLLVLPPVIYFSAFNMSWREFKFNLRSITLLAVGCVLFTTIAVAAAVHWLLGFTWPVAFVLGAIVSPPDPLAPLSIARRLELPRRILVILEGEGLANDAAALILYRFAAAAVVSGAFSATKAAGIFAAPPPFFRPFGIWVGVHVRSRHDFMACGAHAVEANLGPAFAVSHPNRLRLIRALAPCLAPSPKRENDRIEFSAHAGEHVLVPHRPPAINTPLDQPFGFQSLQPRGEHLWRGAGLRLDLVEAGAARKQLPDDQHRPTVSDDRRRPRHGTHRVPVELLGAVSLSEAESRSVLDERALVCGRHIFGWYFPFRVTQLRDARARGGKMAATPELRARIRWRPRRWAMADRSAPFMHGKGRFHA